VVREVFFTKLFETLWALDDVFFTDETATKFTLIACLCVAFTAAYYTREGLDSRTAIFNALLMKECHSTSPCTCYDYTGKVLMFLALILSFNKGRQSFEHLSSSVVLQTGVALHAQ